MHRLVFMLLVAVGACATHPTGKHAIAGELIPDDVGQLVLVEHTAGSKARLTLYERRDAWHAVLGPSDAIVGRRGVAAPGAKREGDGMTPVGLYALGPAFGYAEHAATAMPYRHATPDAVWIDDPGAPDYNTWTIASATDARSFERMRRDDGLYEEGLVIAYNIAPITPGAGSAIFLHVWNDPSGATSGCVAVDKHTLDALLATLDPARKPHILIVR